MENEIKICHHEEICLVTEIPTDGKVQQAVKTYVKCSICNEILPIRSVTQKQIEVPLISMPR